MLRRCVDQHCYDEAAVLKCDAAPWLTGVFSVQFGAVQNTMLLYALLEVIVMHIFLTHYSIYVH